MKRTLLPIIIAFCIISCTAEKEQPNIEAKLVQVFDNINILDELDSILISIGDISKGQTGREVTFIYNIENTTNDTLYFPIDYWASKHKSHINISLKEDSLAEPLFMILGVREILPPEENMLLHINLLGLSKWGKEKIKKDTSFKDILSKLDISFIIDTADIKQSRYPVPNLYFTNSPDSVEISYIDTCGIE